MPQLQRIIRVTVAGLVISEPRIVATIDRTGDATQNRGTIEIYGLSADREQQIRSRGDSIMVEAGYRENFAPIMDGQVQRVTRTRANQARTTTIAIGDLAHARDRLGGVTARSYSGPVRGRAIALDLILDMGLAPGPLDAIPATVTATDYSWIGTSSDGLTALLKRWRLTWYQDDGLARVRQPGVPQPDFSAVLVTPDTGLIGAPTATDEGATITTFLDPSIRVGGIVDLVSYPLTGRWIASAVRHTADNYGDGQFRTWTLLREFATP